MSTLRQFFPTLSIDILQEEQKTFEDKMKYLNLLLADQEKYRQMFPYIPEALFKTYYFEFLDKLDIYRINTMVPFPNLHDFPKRVVIRIFQYTDFHDLVRFAMTNSILYNHINTFLFFKSRITWEREHSRYISYCIFQGRYEDLVYSCSSPIEENYKNQIILKRNLHRINPPDDHPFHDFSSFSVFRYKFKKIYSTQFRLTEIPVYYNIVAKCFDLLREYERRKYDHAAAIAKRYGFIYCFRTVHWTVSKDVYPIKWCEEQAIVDYLDEILGKRKCTIIKKKKPTTMDDDNDIDLTLLTPDNDLKIVVEPK
jgi:hypothetical protein